MFSDITVMTTSNEMVTVVRSKLEQLNIFVKPSFDLHVDNNNYGLHDNETVFVKVLGKGNLPEALIKEVNVANLVNYAPKPLTSVLSSNGLTFSVWEYVPSKQLTTSEANLMHMASISECLEELYSVDVKKLGLDFKGFQPHVPLERLHLIKSLSPEALWNQTHAYLNSNLYKLCEDLNFSISEPVLVHSDLGFRNMLVKNSDGECVLIDHESVHLSDRQYDLATLYQYFVQYAGRDDLFQHMLKVYISDFLPRGEVDWDMFNNMLMFKNIMGLTYSLKKQKWDFAASLLHNLQTFNHVHF